MGNPARWAARNACWRGGRAFARVPACMVCTRWFLRLPLPMPRLRWWGRMVHWINAGFAVTGITTRCCLSPCRTCCGVPGIHPSGSFWWAAGREATAGRGSALPRHRAWQSHLPVRRSQCRRSSPLLRRMGERPALRSEMRGEERSGARGWRIPACWKNRSYAMRRSSKRGSPKRPTKESRCFRSRIPAVFCCPSHWLAWSNLNIPTPQDCGASGVELMMKPVVAGLHSRRSHSTSSHPTSRRASDRR